MHNTLRIFIENGSTSLLKELNSILESFAHLKNTKIEILQLNDELKEIKGENNRKNNATIFLLTSGDALNNFHSHIMKTQELFSMCELNSRLSPSIRLLKEQGWDDNILNFAMIGGQRQFFQEDEYNYLNDKYYDFLHLGDVRYELSEIEPFLRDAHVLRMSFNALRYGDFTSKEDYNPCGFSAEDFIGMARYAGLSPKLNEIVFHDISLSKLETDKPSQVLLIQMLWYMAEGLAFRQKEKYDDPDNEHFVFDLENPELQIDFIRSENSGRWWYSFKDSQGGKHTFSCNYTDFESLQNKIVSNRIKSAILRYL